MISALTEKIAALGNALTACREALAARGVNVPQDTGFSGLPALIALAGATECHTVGRADGVLTMTTAIAEVKGYMAVASLWESDCTLLYALVGETAVRVTCRGSNTYAHGSGTLGEHLTQSGSTVTITPHSTACPWNSGTYTVYLFG